MRSSEQGREQARANAGRAREQGAREREQLRARAGARGEQRADTPRFGDSAISALRRFIDQKTTAPRNALLAPDDTPDVRVDTIYNEARRALIRTCAHTRRRAIDEEKAIRLRIPGWQPSPGEGPVAEWETEWLASG